MNGFPWIILIQIASILVIAIILFLILREAKSLKLQKRFERFALISIHDQEKSIFDSLLEKYWILVKKVGKIFQKSLFLKRYSTRYEKYIAYEDKAKKSGMDYVVIKLTTGTIMIILNIIALIIHFSKIAIPSCLFTFIIGFFIPDFVLIINQNQKKKQIDEDLLKAIIIMNNSFKSGRNIMQAVNIVKEELTGPISDEFKKIHMDMTYGLSTEVVFNRFYERVKTEDAKYIASSLTLLNRTGGNIIRVFSIIEKSFFEKKKLKNEMKSLVAASIFVFRILILLPVLFSLIIYIMNPSYFAPFFKTPFGFLIFLLIIMLYILYIVVIKKVLKVEI